MVTLGRLIFKATGVLSNRGLVKNSRKIGERIAETVRNNNGQVKVAELQQIVKDTVGKKAASKIDFVDKDTFVKRAMDTGAFSEQEVKGALGFADALTLPSKYKRSAIIYMKGDINNSDIAALAAHELHHALSFSSGKLSVPKFIGKFSCGRKYIDKLAKYQKKLGFQEKSDKLYRAALDNVQFGKKFNTETIKELLYSIGVIKVGEDKQTLKVLKSLSKMYKDEFRAYSLQAEVLNSLGKNGLAYSRLAEEFDSLAKGLKTEAKQIRIDRIKKFFGMKPVPKTEPAQVSFVKAENSVAKKVFEKPTD